MAELVELAARWKVMSERDGDRLALVAQGNRCGTRVGPWSSQRCFTEAIVFQTRVNVAGRL